MTTSRPGLVAPGLTSARHGGLLREHDFRFLWIGETTSALGTTISHLALPLVAVVTLQVSTFQVAVLTAASWVPWLVVGLPAGAWVDRLPRRPVMLVCNAASFTLLFSVPIAAWMGMLTFGHLLSVALLTGVASVFFSTAYQVYLPTVVAPEHLMEANAKLQGSESAAQVAGPSLAGLLAQVAGAVTGLAADALSFVVSSVCLLRIRAREEPAATTRRPSTLLEEIGDGVRFLRADPYLRVLTVFGALSNLALTGYQAILVVFLIRELGVSPAVVGLLLSGMSVGGVIGAASATAIARRFGTARGLLLSEICTVPFGLLIPLTAPGPRILLVVLGGLAIGVGIVSGNVLKAGFRQSYCPRHILGRVTVSMQFLNYGTIPLGALVGGALATTIGLRSTLWIMLGGLVLSTLVLLVGPLRHGRDFPPRPAAAVG
jgi:predicted MFS family arabinose efflux permease